MNVRNGDWGILSIGQVSSLFLVRNGFSESGLYFALYCYGLKLY